MTRRSSGVISCGSDELAATQVCQGRVDRAFGESGGIGDRAHTSGDGAPFVSCSLAVKVQTNQIRGGFLVVSDQVAHQHVENVIVDGDGLFETRILKRQVTSNDNRLNAVPLKGQQFFARITVSSGRQNLGPVTFSIMIKQIKFVSIPVRDQNRALDFYTDKLGFTIITDQPFDEKQRWIELRIPKAETRVVLFTPEGDETRIGSFMNMSYACDDIDKTYAELKKCGVEFEGPPQKQPWGTYAMFKDSEGNRFVVSSE
jgi:predicted enzyme related to lactoylglutathione lyase